VKLGSAPRTQAFVTPARLPLERRLRPGASRRTSVPLLAEAPARSPASTTVTEPVADETGRAVTVVVS
jgi:hypothetical protein